MTVETGAGLLRQCRSFSILLDLPLPMSAPKVVPRRREETLGAALQRLDGFTRMVANRLAEHRGASSLEERVLALLEAEAAAKLVESAAYEVSLRLVASGLSGKPGAARMEPGKVIRERLGAFRMAMAAHEAVYGPIVRA